MVTNGEPAVDVLVLARPTDDRAGPVDSEYTDKEGRFQIGYLDGGKYRIGAETDELDAVGATEAKCRETDVRIMLKKP